MDNTENIQPQGTPPVALQRVCSAARARIDDSVRQVWMAYRDASDVSVDMLTEQDMELWGIVTRHAAIQDRLNAMLPNIRS
jgi:hypothetical protein